jgi:hypothetical protein
MEHVEGDEKPIFEKDPSEILSKPLFELAKELTDPRTKVMPVFSEPKDFQTLWEEFRLEVIKVTLFSSITDMPDALASVFAEYRPLFKKMVP